MSFSTDYSVDHPETASTRRVEKVTGSHMFRIMCYFLEKDIGKGKYLESATFSVGGYNWLIRYYPNGEMRTEDDFTSVFIYLKSAAHNIQAETSFVILNEEGNLLSQQLSTGVYTFSTDKKAIGFSKFVRRSAFESVIKDDHLIIRCTVTVFKSFPAQPDFLISVPPPDIQQLSHLLEDGYGADVTFDVNGETFNAHKWILAMRSQVFRAQFFGPLKEESGTVIKIQDMEAPVFKSLLYFIYSERIPEFEEIKMTEQKHNLAQHLLVAADRYDLERLKIMCENILCGSVDGSNVVSLLLLAERHNCIHLKAACLKLLASSEILEKVIAAGQFQCSVQSNLPVQWSSLLHWWQNRWWGRTESTEDGGDNQ